ncbi:MAG: copper chaperone PCu(A)C [Pseudomonadota bacterium]|nr:copper chaperone PCu(A)C [Pseudomonadota bacterium]
MNRLLIMAVLLTAASGKLAACEGLVAEEGWVRQPPPGSRHAAAYVVLSNIGTTPLRITGIRSPDFTSAMLHETLHSEGQARMRLLDGIDLAPGSRFRAKPGGRHIMLSGPETPLGENVLIEVTFDCGPDSSLTASLPVRRNAPE